MKRRRCPVYGTPSSTSANLPNAAQRMRGLGERLANAILQQHGMMLLGRGHDRAVSVECNVAIPALPLRITHLAHLRAFLGELQANILLTEARAVCPAHEVDESIPQTLG